MKRYIYFIAVMAFCLALPLPSLAAGQDSKVASIMGTTVTLSEITPRADAFTTVKNKVVRDRIISSYQRENLALLIIHRIQSDQLEKMGISPKNHQLAVVSQKVADAFGGTARNYNKLISSLKIKQSKMPTAAQRNQMGLFIHELEKAQQQAKSNIAARKQIIQTTALNLIDSWNFNHHLFNRSSRQFAYSKCGLLVTDGVKRLVHQYIADKNVIIYDKHFKDVMGQYFHAIGTGGQKITRKYASIYFSKPWWDNAKVKLMGNGPGNLVPVVL